ncbi:hypothetical protein BC628DRAFT_897634 [Trametes gibbosa]|nr:hypothetical protein BC628DRAFT_897634 [Trametes gibbosa]
MHDRPYYCVRGPVCYYRCLGSEVLRGYPAFCVDTKHDDSGPGQQDFANSMDRGPTSMSCFDDTLARPPSLARTGSKGSAEHRCLHHALPLSWHLHCLCAACFSIPYPDATTWTCWPRLHDGANVLNVPPKPRRIKGLFRSYVASVTGPPCSSRAVLR